MLEFVEAREGDYPRLLSLYQQHKFALLTEEQLRWKYVENPYGPARTFLFLWNGELAGTTSLLPRAFHAAGRTVLGLQGVDGLIGSQLRGKGCFTESNRFMQTQAPEGAGNDYFYYAFAAVPASMRAMESAGWQRLAEFSLFALPLRQAALKRVSGLQHLERLAGVFWPLVEAYLSRPRHPGIDARQVARFEGDATGFFPPNLVHGDRSQAFMDWRVRRNPQVPMRAIEIREAGERVGYCIGKVAATTFEIVDLKLARPDRRFTAALISLLLRDPAIDTLNYWLLVPPGYVDLLPRLATRRRPARGGMFAARLRECGLPETAEGWDVSYLDSDW